MGKDSEELLAEPDRMAEMAARCRDVSGDLGERVSRLDERLTELLGRGWTGDAGGSFSECFQEWHEGAGKVERGLFALADLVDEAGREYEGTDSANSKRLTLSAGNISVPQGDSTRLRL